MTLVAKAATLTAGARSWIEARFEIAPGWHAQGRDPGDADMPTCVTIEAPPSLAVGGDVHPGPRRFADAGDIVTYGYERETMLRSPVDVSADLAAGTKLTLRARGSCVPSLHAPRSPYVAPPSGISSSRPLASGGRGR